MIFRQGEAIYYTQKRVSDGSVWREGELGKVDKIPFLESLTNVNPGRKTTLTKIKTESSSCLTADSLTHPSGLGNY